MEGYVKHLNDITSYSMLNFERQVKNLETRHAPVIPSEEHASFPIKFLPKERNENFYGRQEELERINNYLDPRYNPNLRTYTIYGRRGVGKTDIALQYAHTNPAQFDAIFWVSCETSLALRQSFSDMAVELGIPGADRNGQHTVCASKKVLTNWQVITKRINWRFRNG
jgi:hypothetical protein